MAFQASMAEALRLTRSGNLAEASALLRAALQPGGPSASRPAAPAAPAGSGDLIDLVAERVVYEPRQAASPDRAEAADARARPVHARAPGQFAEHAYSSGGGAMRYWLYVPADAAAGMPLVVMLHGCTQSPEDFARGTGMNRLADEFGFVVAYPAQTQAANPQKCWNWFRPGDQQRDRGEPALLAGVTRQIIAEQRIDADRVYVAGLSAGGAAAAIMADAYPDIFAAVGVHSGLACGAARDLPSALAAMKRGGGRVAGSITGAKTPFVPLITFHGDRDATVNEANSADIVAAASRAAGVALTVEVEEGRSEGGSRYRRAASVGPDNVVLIEQWTIVGAGHAWSGGDATGSYTDPRGPQASREMVRFFLERTRADRAPRRAATA